MGRPCRVCGVPIELTAAQRRNREYMCDTCRCAKNREYRSSGRNALHGARARARRAGLPFTLTLENIPPIPDTCPVLGIPLSWDGGSKGRYNTPSLDRVVNETGYTPDNVVWVSQRANKIKNDATVDEMYRVADFYYERYRERGIQATTRLRPEQEKTDE